MGNAVGKAREHERWQKQMEEDRNTAKVVPKKETNEELANRVLALVQKRSVQEPDLGLLLRLTRIESFRLKTIVENLSADGKLAVTIENGQRTLRHLPMVNREKKRPASP